MRSVIYALSLGLFGESRAIADFSKTRRISGIGLSDWFGYAWRLKKILNYQNTYVHRRPYFDITDVPETEYGSKDFLIAIDVFEHVPPPVSSAFFGASKLLSSGGILVFSAPYTQLSETVEHFPDLNDFHLINAFNKECLINKRTDGRLEIYTDLCFHGSKGNTLEMRIFCLSDIMRHMTAAGFKDITVLGNATEWGIYYENECSHTILARKA